MATIIIDGQEYETREGIPVLQAALEHGFDVPHYCYHPGLRVVASCRLCLMEMKMPHPKTKEMGWAPKLFPSCQTPVRDGMEVRFDSESVKNNQEHVMEYYLVNHPLDCPVCDKAGECYLQDYTFEFGKPTSRAVDAKIKNPKKDIGPRTLLYMDRCVLCSRCVRFTEEISGTNELALVNRGNRSEIDVFPGQPLDNKLQGNVVDICPVGCLLDKDFLHQQRVWYLKGGESICRGCSTGCAIRVDVNKGRVWRLKPRYNPGVNDWWICDEGRFGWKFIEDLDRITAPLVRRGSSMQPTNWESIPELLRQRLESVIAKYDDTAVAVQLSPEMSCEGAWMLASFIRGLAPNATLVLGDVHTVGEDENYPVGCSAEDAKFTIRAEKHPNRRGVETILEALGGPTCSREELWERMGKSEFQVVWITGGYPDSSWVSEALKKAAAQPNLLIVQDLLAGDLMEEAEIVLPFCAWVEREGSFMNHAGLIQPFTRAIDPPENAMRDEQYLYALSGHEGLYDPDAVRREMAEKIPAFNKLHVPPPKPEHQH